MANKKAAHWGGFFVSGIDQHHFGIGVGYCGTFSSFWCSHIVNPQPPLQVFSPAASSGHQRSATRSLHFCHSL
ncbi:MAG: hypothetical protein ABIX01_17155 [Chitinophagaceae bacterium]